MMCEEWERDPAKKYSLAGCVPGPVYTESRLVWEKDVLESESRSWFLAGRRLWGCDNPEGYSSRPFPLVPREYTGW